VARKV